MRREQGTNASLGRLLKLAADHRYLNSNAPIADGREIADLQVLTLLRLSCVYLFRDKVLNYHASQHHSSPADREMCGKERSCL